MEQSFTLVGLSIERHYEWKLSNSEEIQCKSRMFVCLTYKENKTEFVFSDYFLILLLNFVCKAGIMNPFFCWGEMFT